MQEGEDPRYLKVSACCKHYTAYDLENWHGVQRYEFDAIVNDRDMLDTSLLPLGVIDRFQVPFEQCVRKAHASSLVCSYNAVNGIPACADKELLYGTARGGGGFEGYITSDCGAIDTIKDWHHYVNNTDAAVMLGVTATCDLDCGSYYQRYVKHSVEAGVLQESAVNDGESHSFA